MALATFNRVLTKGIDHEAAGRMFDLSDPGVRRTTDSVDSGHLSAMHAEFRSLWRGGAFDRADGKLGSVRQNYWKVYVGHDDPNRNAQDLTVDSLPAIRELATAVAMQVYNPIAALNGFQPLRIMNSIGLLWYPAGEGVLSMHRDLRINRDLVVTVTVSGTAKYAYRVRAEGRELRRYFTLRPGDRVDMRQARNEEELETHRVRHGVSGIGDEDRCVVVFRHYVGGEPVPVEAQKAA